MVFWYLNPSWYQGDIAKSWYIAQPHMYTNTHIQAHTNKCLMAYATNG